MVTANTILKMKNIANTDLAETSIHLMESLKETKKDLSARLKEVSEHLAALEMVDRIENELMQKVDANCEDIRTTIYLRKGKEFAVTHNDYSDGRVSFSHYLTDDSINEEIFSEILELHGYKVKLRKGGVYEYGCGLNTVHIWTISLL